MVQKPGHELLEPLAVLQPVPVLGEGGRVPDRVVGRKPHKPAVQQIVIQLLHQLAFRPNAVEHLQQQCAKQLLRRRRGASFARVKLPQVTVHLAQHIADKLSYLPQRMVRRPSRLRRDVRKQPALIRKTAPHASPRRFMIYIESSTAGPDHGFFSRLLELHREIEVGYCRLVTISTDNITETNEFRTGIGAHWPFLSDSARKIQKELDIAEYT